MITNDNLFQYKVQFWHIQLLNSSMTLKSFCTADNNQNKETPIQMGKKISIPLKCQGSDIKDSQRTHTT